MIYPEQHALGAWRTEAPLTPEQAAEDRAILAKLSVPDGMTIKRLEVYVHGRHYEMQWIDVSTQGYVL